MSEPVVGPLSLAMPYGELERFLSRHLETTPAAIRSRFRKLRLREFPEGLQTGSTGVRVRYDILRLLAVVAVFELNNAYVPQGNAAAIVQATWPEWCRALIAASWEFELLPYPQNYPVEAGAVVAISCAAVRSGERLCVDAIASKTVDIPSLAIRPGFSVDVRKFVRALVDWTRGSNGERFNQLIADLRTLERAFGWGFPKVVDRNLDTMPRGTSFLNEGPYFSRVLQLLEAPLGDFDSQTNPAAQMHLQRLFSYLERPVPIDAYKNEIGRTATEPRLKHYLHSYARSMGLESRDQYPEVAISCTDSRFHALELTRAGIDWSNSVTPKKGHGDH